VNWIGLAKDRNRWRALLNSVLNHRVLGGSSVAAQQYVPTNIKMSVGNQNLTFQIHSAQLESL
jgi:hypothetical protein